ncbi:DUF393 domain-containing protein [Noviherbaspirillum cavernae]|uniref:DUF393 domain-containing protein n=1 Tax=Noviherbaspirillum cavernae TaxID=2320862 RepID=A0A418X4G8_9BURK|nr:DCC1-like thiol-disulfide oxidoreductase family protein [Noviherbaspirillum cavernae]RJG07362.1 DUF393 domain-containing protein [Noviherbaspirillum cavernae]
MNKDNYILYDGDCPFCSNFVKLVQLKKAVGPVSLLNIRENADLAEHYSDKGYNLDQGMLLHLDGNDYWGADCMNRIALLSSESDIFNKLNAAVFRHKRLSKLLYPVLRTGRNMTLRLMGRNRIA